MYTIFVVFYFCMILIFTWYIFLVERALDLAQFWGVLHETQRPSCGPRSTAYRTRTRSAQLRSLSEWGNRFCETVSVWLGLGVNVLLLDSNELITGSPRTSSLIVFKLFVRHNRDIVPRLRSCNRLQLQLVQVWWRPQKTVRRAKTALLFHRAQSAKYALHCAQYAKCTGLNRRWNDLKNQQNLLFVKVFIWRIKFPCKSMAFSNFSYNTLFNATSVKLRLCALSMQKGRCGSWVGKIKSEWKIITQVWRPYLRK